MSVSNGNFKPTKNVMLESAIQILKFFGGHINGSFQRYPKSLGNYLQHNVQVRNRKETSHIADKHYRNDEHFCRQTLLKQIN